MTTIPPNPKMLQDALLLAETILTDIELSQIVLTKIAMKASRLARLLSDHPYQEIFFYEASGYPTTPTGIPPEIFELCRLAGRMVEEEDAKSHQITTKAYTDSIEAIEISLDTLSKSIESAVDPNVSITSANPSQYVMSPTGNRYERGALRTQIGQTARRLSSRRAFIYDYVSMRYIELKYSQLAYDLFSALRIRVDSLLTELLPQSITKLSSIYDNLVSPNPEDWSNAAHSCRKVLQDLADVVLPATTETRTIDRNGKRQTISLGPDQYKNRLMVYVSDNSDSETYEGIVGSTLEFIGDRLDAILKGAQKGSRGTISKEEAERYVVHTYMLVGDILFLFQSKRTPPSL